MNNNPIATATASGGIVGAIVILIRLISDHFSINIPSEGTIALQVLLTPLVHVLVIKYNIFLFNIEKEENLPKVEIHKEENQPNV